jgi:hypothetical protein
MKWIIEHEHGRLERQASLLRFAAALSGLEIQIHRHLSCNYKYVVTEVASRIKADIVAATIAAVNSISRDDRVLDRTFRPSRVSRKR